MVRWQARRGRRWAKSRTVCRTRQPAHDRPRRVERYRQETAVHAVMLQQVAERMSIRCRPQAQWWCSGREAHTFSLPPPLLPSSFFLPALAALLCPHYFPPSADAPCRAGVDIYMYDFTGYRLSRYACRSILLHFFFSFQEV